MIVIIQLVLLIYNYFLNHVIEACDSILNVDLQRLHMYH